MSDGPLPPTPASHPTTAFTKITLAVFTRLNKLEAHFVKYQVISSVNYISPGS